MILFRILTHLCDYSAGDAYIIICSHAVLRSVPAAQMPGGRTFIPRGDVRVSVLHSCGIPQECRRACECAAFLRYTAGMQTCALSKGESMP